MTKEMEWLEKLVSKYKTLKEQIAVSGRSIMKLKRDSNPRLGREHMLDKLHFYYDLFSRLEPLYESFFYDAFVYSSKPQELARTYKISRASVYRWKHRIAILLYSIFKEPLQKFAA